MKIAPEGKIWQLRCAAVLIGAILFAPLFAFSATASPAPSPAETGKYTGPGSCSSTSCHGSVKPRADSRIFQNEYSIWVVKDKHAKAFDALTGPVGERMAHILGLGNADVTNSEPVTGPLSIEISRIGQQIVDSAALSAREKRAVALVDSHGG